MYAKDIRNILKVSFAIILLAFGTAVAIDTAVLKGNVTDAEEKAVKGVEIFIYNTPDTRRPADFISARTDISGNFSITIPPGKYWAVARLRHGEKYGPLMLGDKHSGEPVEIEVEAGEEFGQDFTVVDIRDAARLIRKTREDHFRLEGKIVDKKGAPLKNVYAIANREKEVSEVPDYLSAWTDEGGRYILYLTAGKYYIGYAAEFPPGESFHIFKELNLEPENTKLDIIVDDADSSVTGSNANQ